MRFFKSNGIEKNISIKDIERKQELFNIKKQLNIESHKFNIDHDNYRESLCHLFSNND